MSPEACLVIQFVQSLNSVVNPLIYAFQMPAYSYGCRACREAACSRNSCVSCCCSSCCRGGSVGSDLGGSAERTGNL